MITHIVWLLISLIALWLLSIALLWRIKERAEGAPAELAPLVQKSARTARRTWFLILRWIARARLAATRVITKGFFTLFPKARKAFEQKDQLTGLEQGPSSYFLKSISEGKDGTTEPEKKIRRKRKNV